MADGKKYAVVNPELDTLSVTVPTGKKNEDGSPEMLDVYRGQPAVEVTAKMLEEVNSDNKHLLKETK